MKKLFNTKSFTLVEVMIVLIIIGILFVGSVVSFQTIRQSANFHNAVNDIEGIIKDARTYAVTSRIGTEAGYTSPPEYYKIEIKRGSGEFLLYRQEEPTPIKGHDLPDNITIQPATRELNDPVGSGADRGNPHIYYYPPYGKVIIVEDNSGPANIAAHASVLEIIVSDDFGRSEKISINDISGFPERWSP